jgi:epoxyqueuosine reductase
LARPNSIGAQIKESARQLGFDLVGATPAGKSQSIQRYREWLACGYHAQMAYLSRPNAVDKRGDPRLVLPDVDWVVVVAANYAASSQPGQDPARGLVSRYARGEDYHDLLLPRLRQLATIFEDEIGSPVDCRAYVDTGPVLEREWAARSGLGFVGKNTCLISPSLGSWLFLGVLLVHPLSPGQFDAIRSSARIPTIELPVEPDRQGTCGACTRCLDACPTGALIAPYVLDARRCISYLTIELKGAIPRELRPSMGNRIFGCDICQEVCPWNLRYAQPSLEPAFQPKGDAQAPLLLDLIVLDDEGFRSRFRSSPIKRAKRRGLLRNVAVALGNWANPSALPALEIALRDAEPLIRGHAAWALGRIGGDRARRALQQALDTETEAWVREEIGASLAGSPAWLGRWP